MKPTYLKPGDEVLKTGSTYTFVFVKRISANDSSSGKSQNIFRCEAYRGLNGPNDEGIVTMSDYEVSRSCRRVSNVGSARRRD